MTNDLTGWWPAYKGYNQLYIGYSGGLDSTVLLHILASQPDLLSKITAVHINHGISKNALSWQLHCEQFCREHNISFIARQVEFIRDANIEERAREARYQVFQSLLTEDDCLLLAHHRDDQAETLLLHLFRGAGISGLAAMPAIKALEKGILARPLLNFSRQQLEQYAVLHQLQWIDDESNLSSDFSRNFIRNQLMPLIQTRWPNVQATIARTANHCQQGQDLLEQLAVLDCLEITGTELPLKYLNNLDWQRANNVLRVWLKSNKVRLPDTVTFNRIYPEVIHAKAGSVSEIAWLDNRIKRHQQKLYLLKEKLVNNSQLEWNDFPNPLPLPYGSLTAIKSEQGIKITPDSKIIIRFRSGGEHMRWHGQTKAVKKLLQEWQIPHWQRNQIPFLYINDKLAAITGYAISDDFYAESGSDVYSIDNG
ncbi:tRNA lysidine(34) synthetase TilS [Legionella dresdenensis]|uniref:tRNA(Ile)-lysidine synthase n=1 Tax=Legionella dresdenensis TaxID=450200 RepID=A0ABV8CCJ1_9GAMM